MLSLKNNRTALANLDGTLQALDRLDILIEHYSEDKPGPVYMDLSYTPLSSNSLQIDRKLFVPVLVQQRQKLVDYLATLNIDANS